MRLKKQKNATDENLTNLNVILDIRKIDTSSYEKVYVEIGAGKGRFICALAADYLDSLFIGFEKDKSVAYSLAKKKAENKLDNLIIICNDAKHLLDYFAPCSIDKIYLNFSDPWPKTKHHKRRLTFKTFIDMYLVLLKPAATLELRTDHLDFFNDSLGYFENHFDLVSVNQDLAESAYMTEYEVKKRQFGQIYHYKGVKK